MPTDTERREVAERLRRAWANVPDKNPVRHHMRVLYEIYAVVGLNDDRVDAIDLFDRLADLIEPDDHFADTGEKVDRDALLRLADEMEEFGNLPVKHPGIRVLHNDDFSRELGYARRIRKALGVSDD